MRILVADDELGSPIVATVRRRLEAEGWEVAVPEDAPSLRTGDDFEEATLYSVEEQRPDAVLLDVRFGEHRDDRFKGLSILRNLVERHPQIPVLMFTQYAQGPEREAAVTGSLRWDARVDFIDKLASPEEVVLRLRRLIGTAPQLINVGRRIVLNLEANTVSVVNDGQANLVREVQGMKFEVMRELAVAWYRSPGELVPFSRLERYSEGDDARASLRVRIREIKDALGRALGMRFGGSDLILNVRDQGYRLVAPET